jgi:hypothetical protein
VQYISATSLRADFNLAGAPFNQNLDMEVTNGCGTTGQLANCWSTALVYSTVRPNMSIPSGGTDIWCGKTTNDFGVLYSPPPVGTQWRRFINDTYSSYYTYLVPFGTLYGGYCGPFDAGSTQMWWGIRYGSAATDLSCRNMWANFSFTGGGGGSSYNANYRGVRGMADRPGQADEAWCWYGYGGAAPVEASVYWYRLTGTSTGSAMYTTGAPWLNGTGNTGVVANRLKGIAMDPDDTSPYRVYTLETDGGSGGNAECWNLASTPTLVATFGAGSFYYPVDISTDPAGFVYVLCRHTSTPARLWVYDPTGHAILDHIFTTGEVSGTPLRLDNHDLSGEVHILHTGGVTRCTIY